ncbi:PLP-dependent aminotransferase family protein [Rugamonas sp. CCM 8940]|uniref:MocR-like pyridoxine biosynthesis transcription factor PdxR n=1 Tax=Rugamonas sp. CCM 8940 TaxID=2765359 RepID=UPI0018F68ECE|nr:PLP-dependent aminotransferase family protein [Rugamonas sp. CCM 8940]MBJ7314306.1 PLP-dependent aminotransferase family protein [Rugamonas sp. CCM 8940]
MARGKSAEALDLPRPPALDDGDSAATKQDTIYETLRAAILRKWLPADSRLPSSRELAARWGVSRGTVEAAFDRLHAEAYVARRAGSGTRVCAVVPERFLTAAYRVHASPDAASGVDSFGVADSRRAPTPAASGARGGANAAAAAAAAPPATVETRVLAGLPFVSRMADPALFPLTLWAKYVSKAIVGASTERLCSPDARGAPELREQIAGYLRSHRGMACAADDIVVTTGIRHALDLIARSLLGPGDLACVEDPGYTSAARIFALAGARTVFAPVGAEGIDCAALRAHHGVRLAFVTPAHQSPLGVTMSVSRRLELLDWASEQQAWIVEDDYDSEFNYHSAPLPALKSLDRHDRVIHCGSFNKTLFAGLRIGFIVAPPAVRGRLMALWQTTGRSVGISEQMALAEYIRDGAYVRHLRLARRAYQQRRDTLLACLAASGRGQGGHVSGCQAGFHCMLWLPPGCDELDFCARAAARDIALQPLSAFCREAALPPAVLLGYTALTLAQVRYAGQKLAQLLDQAWAESTR